MRKRDKGIYKIDDNHWRIAVSYTDPITGKTERKFKRVKGSYEEAKKQHERLEEKYQGISKEAFEQTMKEYLMDWLEGRKSEIANSTWGYYRNLINKWTIPIIGNVVLADMNPRTIKNWHERMKNKGASDLTVKQAHNALKLALKEAVFEGTIKDNPADRVKTPKAKYNKRGYLEPVEIERMISVLDSMELTGFTMAVYLGIGTGARRSEILGLQWQDFNETRGTVYIQRSLSVYIGAKENGRRTKEYKEPKTETSTRKITLNDSTLNKLLEWKEIQAKQLAEFGLKQSLDTPICHSFRELKKVRSIEPSELSIKLALNPSGFSNWFHEFCEEHSFYSTTGKILCFHNLRHAQATILLTEGIPDMIVAGHLGHASSSVTRELYGHFMPERDRECANVIEGVTHGKKKAKIIPLKTA